MTGNPPPLVSLSLWALLVIAFNARCVQAKPTEATTAPQPSQQQLTYHQHNIANLLGDVERRYGEAVASLRQLRLKLEQKERELATIQQGLRLLEKNIGEQQKILAAEVKAAYQMGKQQRLKLLLNQNDPALSGRMLKYFQYFTQQRIDEIRRTEKLLADLDSKNQQLRQQRSELEGLLSQKKMEQAELAKAKEERNKLLARLTGLSAEEQLRQLRQSETVIASLLGSSPNTGSIASIASMASNDVAEDDENTRQESVATQRAPKFSELKGKLRPPTEGRIVQQFGSPRLETVWDGILIAAPEGTEVHAVADGKVVFAKWLKSYGYLMILEHGTDYMTLYAFNQSLFKRKHDAVRSGEIIAAVGQSGGRLQPGLYFAIRKQGVAVDPASWWQK